MALAIHGHWWSVDADSGYDGSMADRGDDTSPLVWYIRRSGKLYGPFSMEAMSQHAEKGKLNSESLVTRDPFRTPIPITEDELLANALSPHLGAHATLNLPEVEQTPDSSDDEPARRRMPEGEPQDIPTKLSDPLAGHRATLQGLESAMFQSRRTRFWARVQWILLALFLIGSAGSLVILLLPPSEEKNTLFAKLQTALRSKPSLRTIQPDHPFPPANSLFADALTRGMFLDSEELFRAHQEELLLLNEERSAAWGTHFPQARREIRFQQDAGYQFSYLLNDENIVFCVIIASPVFDKMEMQDYHPDELGSPVRTMQHGPATVWETDIHKLFTGRALWRSVGDHHRLRFLSMTTPETQFRP